MFSIRRSAFAAAFATFLLLAGCRIDTHESGNGKADDVKIGTPFGSLSVKTDQANAVAQTGLTPYPGATPVHKEGNDNGAADVNMSFGSFKLGVHAVELQTADPQDKVLAFYRRDLGRYGVVITCNDDQAVGQPTRTADGLACNEHDTVQGYHSSSDGLELRAGSETHQHIVGVHPGGGGTRIGLVALDLPAELNKHDSGSRE